MNDAQGEIPKGRMPFDFKDIEIPIHCLFKDKKPMIYSRTVSDLYEERNGLVGLFSRNVLDSQAGRIIYDLLWAANSPALTRTEYGLYVFEGARVLSLATNDLGGLITNSELVFPSDRDIKKYPLLPTERYIPLILNKQSNGEQK